MSIERLRTGIGTDAHTFTSDGQLGMALAGLSFPDAPALDGQTDGDVAAHALADAILSAAGQGDLGSNFSTADPEWRAAAGTLLLSETARRVRLAGFEIVNAAVQIVGNRPKIAARRTEAEEVLSQAVGAPISVSGTTSDGLGFTGRGEGLAAIATALLLAPGR